MTLYYREYPLKVTIMSKQSVTLGQSVKAEVISSPVVSTVKVLPTYLVAIPTKANFSVDRRQLIVNDQVIGLPLDQKEVMIELAKPIGQNQVSIEDWCLTNLIRNIAVEI